MAKIIDGKVISAAVKEEVAKEVAELKAENEKLRKRLTIPVIPFS